MLLQLIKSLTVLVKELLPSFVVGILIFCGFKPLIPHTSAIYFGVAAVIFTFLITYPLNEIWKLLEKK